MTYAETTVGELVVARPSRARVFEKHGIDYCCGGKKPLQQACAEKGINVQRIELELNDEAAGTPSSTIDWSAESLGALADHIEQTHHAYLKEELPRLEFLTTKVAARHGERVPELVEVRDVFLNLKAEMESHMMKEERILFPMCRELDTATDAVSFHCGSVKNPVAMMMKEHDDAGDALATMRKLTGDYVPPADACNTYRAMLAGLAQLEADMHQHVHKENNILFPKAVAIESRLNGE